MSIPVRLIVAHMIGCVQTQHAKVRPSKAEVPTYPNPSKSEANGECGSQTLVHVRADQLERVPLSNWIPSQFAQKIQ